MNRVGLCPEGCRLLTNWIAEKVANQPARPENERKRFINLLKEKKTKGTIILSGDRHSAEISKLDGALPYPLYDITSSAMNQRQRPKLEENIHRLGNRYFEENFGLLKIEWLPNGPKVSTSIRDITGNTVMEYELGIF